MKVCPACGASFSPDQTRCSVDGAALVRRAGAEHLVGRLVDGRYRLLELLGHGSTGAVFRARHEQLRRDLALKVLWENLAQEPRHVGRFTREVQAIAAIDHPHIIEIHDSGRDPAIGYYAAMRLLEGTDLHQRLKAGPALDSFGLFAVFDQTAQGLEAAHERGIVHRDVKPANIFLQRVPAAPEGFEVRVLDFGIAKIFDPVAAEADRAGRLPTDDARIVGTPVSMAPEQIVGGDVDARTDIYSLGALFFRCLTGRYPFMGRSVREILMGHLDGPVPAPRSVPGGAWVPEEISRLVWRMLAKGQADRPASMREVRRELGRSRMALHAAYAERDESPILDAPPKRSTPERGERPLLVAVDDESVMLELTRVLANDAGYECESFTSGAEALVWMASARRPHAVLLDLFMPEMDGLEVLDRLRQQGYTGPVIVSTAVRVPALRERLAADPEVTVLDKATEHHLVGAMLRRFVER